MQDFNAPLTKSNLLDIAERFEADNSTQITLHNGDRHAALFQIVSARNCAR